MHVSPALVTLRSLIFVPDSDTLYCKVDEFLQILNTSKSKSGNIIRKFNLWKEIQNYQYPSVKTIDGNNYLSLESAIRYSFNHAGTNEICQKVCKEVTDSLILCHENEKEVIVAQERTTILELYQKIAENSLFDIDELDELQADILLLDIPSLYTCYREEFQQLIWNKICLFEWHFHFKHPDGFVKFEDEVKAKWAYYDQCISSEKLSKQLRTSCNDVIERNKLRREASACINSKGCEVSGVLHSFGQLEKAATHAIYDLHLGSSRTVCLQCGDVCKSQLGLHIFVELSTDIGDVPKADLQDIAFLLQKELADKHKLSLHEVVFLVPKTLDGFKCTNCPENNFHRYELYHALVGKKLMLAVIHVSTFETDTDEDQPESRESTGKKYCKECTNDVKEWIQYPLDWMSFSLLREWHLFLPLPIQILLSGLFLNKRNLTRSLDSQQFFHKRIQRLYCLLDIGLNTLNQKHCGILPEMNSVELLFNHRSASTVFSLTNEMGISQSWKTSTKWLETESDGDNCFFKTFIKKYTLMYQRIFEEDISSSSVGMKDCFVILGLDNLVRLTTHTDPNPGENRTSQLCTIPMTLKGLPRDCSLVASWHKPDCDAEPGHNCECMERNQLDVGSNSLLFKLLPCEQAMQSKFDVQSTWGLCSLWSDIGEFITRNIDNEPENLDNLNQTMESLNLGDDTTMQEEILPQVASEEPGRRPGESNEIPIQEESRRSKQHAFDSDVIIPTQSTADEFTVFPVPPLLTRHPRPAIGRDDDKAKLREILLEILQSLGRYPNNRQRDRILLAPDHKLSKNLILLMKEEATFQQFLPEFPVLHLKKSKILNLFSAYKDAGLHELLQYMKDDEHEKDWKKLITFHNIETAAKNIKRLALAFHIAFLTKFIDGLAVDEQKELLNDMESNSLVKMQATFQNKYEQFIMKTSSVNATFALHQEMMNHCDEIAAICLAERIGGPCGYNLMLSAVKRSLPFAFLNGASSYATFCVELLHEHYTAGIFHKQLKASLFTTPHQGSNVNIALDTQREMDHRDALKAFRPGAALSSIIPKMAIVDTMAEITAARKTRLRGSLDKTDRSFASFLEKELVEKSYQGMVVTKKDLQHVLPAAQLILRRKGLEVEDISLPRNVYKEQQCPLAESILDKHSYAVGKFLAHKYCFKQRLFMVREEPDITQVEAGKDLKSKLKQSKGLTIKRTSIKPKKNSSEVQKREEKRKTDVKKKTKYAECWSSDMNTCQAVVKPDCSKASVPKACGMRSALIQLLSHCTGNTNDNTENFLHQKGLLLTNCKSLPRPISKTVTTATVEFAGIKFKTTATSGKQYMLHVQNGIIKPLQKQLPNLKRLIICEEKYTFTPDDFKAATRANRQKKVAGGISHLKLDEDIVSSRKLSKPAIRETSSGKRLISSYLASNVRLLELTNITVDIDSELLVVGCSCDGNHCNCHRYSRPKRVVFDENGFKEEYFLEIKQRKGEAEMAQVDWLTDITLGDDEAVLSVVTSGDIDSVAVHLFGTSRHWPRRPNGKYKNPVFVLLQKPKPDLYNITSILELLEDHFDSQCIGQYTSMALCLGGNDFLPKFHGISHKRWMETILKAGILPRILVSDNGNLTLNKEMYFHIVKCLYCPPALDSDKLSFQDVRDISIRPPGKPIRNPNLWMPPLSALEQLARLIDLQIFYLQSAWDHEADLPDFEGSGCLVKKDQHIELNLGPDVHCSDVQTVIQKSEAELRATIRAAKHQRKKRQCPETPDKQARKRPLISTPRRRTLIPVSHMDEELSDIEPIE